MTHQVSFIFYFTFLLIIFERICITQMSFQDNGSLQDMKDTYIFSEDLNLHKEFSLSGTKLSKIEDSLNGHTRSFLKFEPDVLDFKERILGVPYHERVTVINQNSNKTIIMTSISGNTVHFHSSFFEDKVIPPNGNTTFNVVFLGRQEGAIESILLIHTSEGSVKYKVKGMSAANPYRLRPLVDIRLPLNASFSPLIHMYNPHSTAIQITEVYSSGGEFHLELPTGELEGPKQMWEIPPYQTRPVIRVRFNAKTEANHTAYIRIKLNKSEEVLIVPLEVEVGSFPGLHAPQGGVEFGVGGSLDAPKKIKLLLHNTWKKAIRIHNIVTRPVNDVIKIDFQPTKISPLGKTPTLAAYLTINWNVAHELKQFYGEVIVRSKQIPDDIVIPYWATVVPGGLIYNASAAQYLSNKRSLDLQPRNFPVTNFFSEPLVVINVSLPTEAQSYFLLQNFQPVVVQPNETVNLFRLKCIRTEESEFHFESNIFIHTNVSTVRVPLLSYDGKLKLVIPFSDENETVLDLGLVGTDSVKESYLILINLNPIEVSLKNWATDLKNAKFTLVGCNSGNITEAATNYEFLNVNACESIKPNEYAVFLLSVKASNVEDQLTGEIIIETTFEHISIPVKLNTAPGKFTIEPERIVFDNCFPSTICTQILQVHSTFPQDMYFTQVNSLPYDARFKYEISNKTAEDTSLHIVPKVSRIVANLYFDTSLTCSPYCYTGFILNSTVGTQWLTTFTLMHSTLEFDLKLLNTMYGRYLNVTSKGLSRWQNLTLRLDTTEVKGYIFNTRVKMTWPKLLSNSSSENKSFLMFPITQVGNISTQTLTFYNPSSYPIILHLVMEAAYPGGRKLYEQLPNGFKRIYPNTSGVSSSTFYFDTTEHAETNEFFEVNNITKHPETIVLALGANKFVDVNIHFNATSSTLKSTLLYIRNNLTVIEVVRLVGQGAYPALKFGNRKPGSTTPLMFELTDKHLKDCEKEKMRKHPSPNLTVKRSFTARNVGDVSIYIKGFYINGYACEGFGFKVLNCEPFNLPPNETRKVDIAFTPDFTLAKIQRTLIIDTSLNIKVNYTLITTVPPYYLAPCSLVLSRPGWENFLYYISVGFMFFMLLCVLTGAFLESDRIIQTTVAMLTKDSFTMQQPLDLRLIGAKSEKLTKNEVEQQNHVQHAVSSCCKSNNSTSENDTSQKKSKETTVSNTKNTSSWVDVSTSKNRKNVISPQNSLFTNSISTPIISFKNTKKNVKKSNSDSQDQQKESKKTPSSPTTTTNIQEKIAITNIRNKTNTSPVNIINKKAKSEEIVKKETQKVTHLKKPLIKKKVIETASYEEDTSSTTTEYSNNEEGDKENMTSGTMKNDKNRKFITKKMKVNDFRDNYEGDDEDNEKKTVSNTHHHHHQWKSRSSESKNHKSNHDHPANQFENQIKFDKEVVVPHKRLNRNNNRDKKEKIPLKKRSEKHHVNGKLNPNTTDTFKYVSSTRTTPAIPPTNCWGETRARFSDVVAGSDTSLNSKECKTTKGSVTNSQQKSLFNFHDPIKSIDTESTIENQTHLGPIGSKKSSINIWESVPSTTSSSNLKSSVNTLDSIPPSNDSFFVSNFIEPTTLQTLDNSILGAATSSSNSLNYGSDLWDNQTSAAMINLLHNSARSMLGDYSNTNNFYSNTSWAGNNNSFWGSTGYLPPAVGEERQQIQQQNMENVSLAPGVSSFWNTSPWTSTTLSSDVSTRTPPGFPARPQTRDEEIDRDLAFDPFRSLSNIWSPSRSPPS